MPRHYVTLGQRHAHRVNGKTLDCDCVVVYEARDAKEGRKTAFALFGDQFFTDYHDKEWDEGDLHYFPRGYVEVNV